MEAMFMAPELRHTGISAVGDVPWGTHFCHFYESKEDLLDILIPYFKAGLENGEFCVWVVSEPLDQEAVRNSLRQAVPETDRYLATGRIEIVPHTEWYLKDGAFIAERVIADWNEKLAGALAKGYAGMRANGSGAWLTEESRRDFVQYEKTFEEKVANQQMIVLCSYPLSSSSAAEIFDVGNIHQLALLRRRGNWEVLETPELAQAKQEIKRLNEKLEQRVIERTSQLAATNEELRKEITERARAEMALRRSEDNLRLVIDTIPVMAWTVQPDGAVDFINQRWLDYTGLTWEQYVQNPLGAVHPDDAPDALKTWQANVATEQRYEYEMRLRRSDGQYRWFLVRVEPLRDPQGNLVKWYGVSIDIEESRQAEALLHAKEQEFRAIVENAPDQIIRYDREFRRVYVNPAVASAYGLPAEALIGKPMGSVIQDAAGLEVKEGELNQLRQRIAAVFDTGKASEFEITWPLPMGRKYFSIRVFPELDLNGSVINVLGIARDITERKQAEEELKREKEVLKKIFDNIPVMIGFVGDDGVKLVNPEWERTIGWTLKELQEQNVDIFVEAYPDPRYRQEVLDFVAASTGEWIDLKIKVRDGRVIDAACAVIDLSDGTRVAIAQDITERKQAEEKLLQSERQLAEAQRLAHIGSWDWDLRTNRVTWSDELYHIFGLQPGTISVAGQVDRFIHPDDLDLGWHMVKRAIASKKPYDYYHRIIRPDGTERIARSRGSIVIDERGEPIKVFGATQDVTELKHAEAKLKETSKQLRARSASYQTAREEESKRIAREIHDELGGALTSWRWDLEEIREVVGEPLDSSQVASLRTKINAMIKLTETTLATVRKLSSELRPPALELGLVEALEWQVLQFRERTGIAVELVCPMQKVDLDNGAATAVFRILQEALTNIQRHAQATQVTIRCQEESQRFILTIKDNGRGITESEKSASQSLGLLGMSERAQLAGGEINIENAEDGGTRITVSIPVTDRELASHD